MSKFANAFSDYRPKQTASFNSEEFKAKRIEQNKQRVEIFGTPDKPRSRTGVISGIYDLGLQETIGRQKSTLTAEQEAAYLVKNPDNWFEDVEDYQTKKIERMKCWKQIEPAAAITVDFPQWKFDWGGDIGVKSFRFLLNGEEFTKDPERMKSKGVGYIYSLKETTKNFPDKVWSLAKNSIWYKLALATNIIKKDEPFPAKRIGELIGRAAQFEVGLIPTGDYANEKITFKGEVPEGLKLPEVDEDDLFFIRFDIENEVDHVKQIRWNVLNQMKRASNWEGSKLKGQVESVKSSNNHEKTESNQDSNDQEDYDNDDQDCYDDDIPF